ncbi:hypothetical protein U0035_10740 [Niabella yanshanensis]|uniref:Uncharacterized protein n=1 Tax=Niabella yanshanensis TaxID=577386 RepID=A0ABZ0WBD7_9BACT|nr:hypothetical protein [Niabella yanshanensis]WQD40625.1 hypothetical protein U0035_10740 [Niabella yanshanensis]
MTSEKQTFPQAAQSLTEVLTSVSTNDKEVSAAINLFLDNLPGATTREVATAMQSLAGVFETAKEVNAINAIMLCGYLVEKGYGGKYFIGELERLTIKNLDIAEPLLKASVNVMETTDDEEEDPYEAVDKLREEVVVEHPEQIAADDWLEKIYPCLVSTYSSDLQLFNTGKSLLHDRVKPYSQVSTACSWLSTLFSVLFNEPVLVVELAQQKAFTGSISGIADNFQLQLLLMGIPELGDTIDAELTAVVNGTGPQDGEASVAGKWDMCNWPILSAAHKEKGESDSDHWIWSEGSPEDIEPLEGRRVILLKEPSYQRGLYVQRSFSTLPASINIEKWLSEEELNQWLEKMK